MLIVDPQYKPPKVLILSASVGAGHVSAALAVEAAFRQMASEAVIKHVDVLDFATTSFRQVYGKLYIQLIDKAPQVLGYFYDLLDKKSNVWGERLRLAAEKMNLQKFLKLLQSETWDIVINTHFLPAEIIASQRKKKETFHSPIYCHHGLSNTSSVDEFPLRGLFYGHAKWGGLPETYGNKGRNNGFGNSHTSQIQPPIG